MSIREIALRRGQSAAVLVLLTAFVGLCAPTAAPQITTVPTKAAQEFHKPSASKKPGPGKSQEATCLEKARQAAAQTSHSFMIKAPGVPVPNLKDKTKDQAQSLIGDNLLIGPLHNENPQWVIEQQDPPPDRVVPICTSIELWMSSPPVRPSPKDRITKVPDVRQWPETQIQSRLNDFHLTYAGTTQKETKDVLPGTIFDQYPEPESQVPWGFKVIRYSALSPAPQPPMQVNLAASADSLLPRETVTFTAKLEPDLPGPRYQFDFGDGTPDIESDGPQVKYAYEKDGNYSVRVTASLDGKQVQSQILAITVHSVIYTVTLAVSPQDAHKGQPVEFHAQVFPPTMLRSKPEYLFSFGDKSKPVASASADVTHAYQEARTYEATVSFVAEHGHRIKSGPVEVAIVIPPPPPPPLWIYIAIAFGVLAGLGAIGHKWARNYVTRGVNVSPRPGTGEFHPPVIPGGVVEAGFGFRAVHPPAVSNADFQQPVIIKIERML